MIPIVRPDRVAQHRSAVEPVDDAQPVNRSVGPPKPGVDRRDRLGPRHVVNIDLHKPAGENTPSPLSVSGSSADSIMLFSRKDNTPVDFLGGYPGRVQLDGVSEVFGSSKRV